MSDAQQWIPLSGPGSRLPTADDADQHGNVWYYCPKIEGVQIDDWKSLDLATHWCPIPKAPPLPKPVELSQHDLDWDKSTDFINNHNGDRANLMHAIAYGRADGRQALAQEIRVKLLGAGSPPLFWMANYFEQRQERGAANGLMELEKLLTEAART
jgi:hypothetical protein